jgi:glucosamine--fructose-6-phosphate aminotransferase (isomerizing)
VIKIPWELFQAEKDGFRHFMLKEIHEQPQALMDTVRGRLQQEKDQIHLDELGLRPEAVAGMRRGVLVACGTSWHAALVGRYLIEDLARLPIEVEIGSEFRYRDPLVDEGTLFLAISQSGETADTLAAMREARSKGARCLAVCNVVGSTMAREADGVLYTHAGPEIGVAATKTFTTQLTALLLLAIHLGRQRGTLDARRVHALSDEILSLPRLIEEWLKGNEKRIEDLARRFSNYSDFLYLGRGIHYPIALEGALKLKELSYIHAEGYPAGEMKHGPIALIDEVMPVVILAPPDKVYDKVMSNLMEVKARSGIVIAVGTEGDKGLAERADAYIPVPAVSPYLMPILMTVPLQLLAYHIAIRRGCDVDQPRNLAKSVTVE